MAIPSQQIGWSQKAKLLWNISKQLEKLTQVASNVTLPTTTTTTTTPTTTTTTTSSGLFSGTVEVLAPPYCVSSPIDSFLITGDGTTFCNSTQFSGVGFLSLTGNYALRFGTDLVGVITNNSSTATLDIACYQC
jgi:hypothetical protein